MIFVLGVVVGVNAPINEELKTQEWLKGYESGKNVSAEPEIDSFLYNGIYGWFCDDTSSYEPAIFDVKQSYIDRKCHLISIDIYSVNRSYYLENGWD